MQKKNTKKPLHSVLILSLIAVFAAGFVIIPFVRADRFEEQIRSLNQQNTQSQSVRQRLTLEAESLEAAINLIQNEIDVLEGQIRENQAKSAELQREIEAAEEELAKQRLLLGQNIRVMYLTGDMSTLEMLASSKDLSDFVDRQQYHNSVKTKIRTTLEKVNALKQELTLQRINLEKLILDQEAMQGQLALQRAEQDRLLNLNQEQRRAIEAEIRANNARISELRRQQAIENARLFSNGWRNIPDTSGYPWANYQPFPNTVADPWGMYLRQCVSYTAWKVWKSGRHMPYWGGHGNANQWPGNARAAGIPVDGSPRVGDVAVSMAGFYGHTMYVEHVYGDGTILISQYNAGWDGRYSEARISASGLLFIHFP